MPLKLPPPSLSSSSSTSLFSLRHSSILSPPRRPFYLQPFLTLQTRKHASISSSSPSSSSYKKPPPPSQSKKPGQRRVLAKPDKFTPPSHPARRVMPAHRPLPLPPLTPKQAEEREYKQYPGMRFHRGSVGYWVLTTRWVHVFLTLATLLFFSVYTFLNVFLQKSPFVELLPARSTFAKNPVEFLKTYHTVWKMTTEHDSAIVKEKQEKNLADLEKRRKYAKIHGLDHEYWFFGWGLESLRDGDRGQGVPLSAEEEKRVEEMPEGTGAVATFGKIKKPKTREEMAENRGIYLDWDGKRRPLKKWFGIW